VVSFGNKYSSRLHLGIFSSGNGEANGMVAPEEMRLDLCAKKAMMTGIQSSSNCIERIHRESHLITHHKSCG
jgi:hypothetical protein